MTIDELVQLSSQKVKAAENNDVTVFDPSPMLVIILSFAGAAVSAFVICLMVKYRHGTSNGGNGGRDNNNDQSRTISNNSSGDDVLTIEQS